MPVTGHLKLCVHGNTKGLRLSMVSIHRGCVTMLRTPWLLWPFEWENHDEPMELASPHPFHRVNYFCSQNPRDCWNLFLQKCMTKYSVPTVPIQVIDGPSALKIPSPSLSGMDPDGMDPVSSNMAGRWEIPRTNWGFAGKTAFLRSDSKHPSVLNSVEAGVELDGTSIKVYQSNISSHYQCSDSSDCTKCVRTSF